MRGRAEDADDPVRYRVIKAILEWASVLQDTRNNISLSVFTICQHTTALLYYAQQLAQLPEDGVSWSWIRLFRRGEIHSNGGEDRLWQNN